MKLYFKEDGTLAICPEDSIEVMALKYWAMEYQKHGDKLLEVETEIPKAE